MRRKNLLLSLLAILLAFNFSAKAEGDNNVDKQSYFQKARVNQHSGIINPADVFAARQSLEKISNAKALDLNWIEVGPDNYGGRVEAIVFDNQDATGKTFYVGAIAGGMWKTTTGGLTWDKINNEQQNIFATSLVQAENGDVYAGTGLKGKYVGQGLFKCTDGNNFNLIEATNPALNENSDWAYINNVKIDGSGNIYVATNTALLFSSDGGENWTKAKADGEVLEGENDNVEVSPNGTIYTSFNGKAYVSTSGIEGFVCISDDGDESLLPDYNAEMFKFSASNVNNDVAYALIINEDGELFGVYSTADNGATWSLIAPGGGTQFAPYNGGTGLDASCILADPIDADKVYVCGNSVYVGIKPNDGGYFGWDVAFNSFITGFHDAILSPKSQYLTYYATDFGVVSFNRINSTLTEYNNYLNISAFNSVAEGINDNVLAGEKSYGNISFEYDGNTSLNAVTVRRGKAGFTELSVINPELMILSGENLDIQRTNDFGLSYSNNFIAEVLGANTNAEYTPFALWESFNDVNSKDSLYYHATEDLAANTVITMRSGFNKYPFEYTLTEDLNEGDSVLVMDKIGAKFFVAVKDGAWMTEDVLNLSKEPEWWEISDFDGLPTSIAYSTDGNYVFIGTEEGSVYRLSNIVEAYDALTADIENETAVIATDLIYENEDRVITSIAVDPNNADHVVITCGNYGNDNYVFESNNAIGDTPEFTSIQNNLPKAPVFSALIEMHDSNRIILGTEYGIFTKEGNSWTKENGEMGNVPVTQIQQQTLAAQTQTVINSVDPETGNNIYKTYKGIENNGVIYISTDGRGLWKAKNYLGINTPSLNDNTNNVSSLNVYPNPVSENASINIDANYGEKLMITIYDLSGRVVSVNSFVAAHNGNQKISLNVSELISGTYLVQVRNGASVENGKFTIL